MLSSQTKDEVTDAAVAKLRAALGGSLSLDALLAAEEHIIADSINKVGFWRRKTQFVLNPLSLVLPDLLTNGVKNTT
jgi:endonuclease III